jgi:xanthine dehydrogenase iron-sulfur cluster and FAD-binding subunit A
MCDYSLQKVKSRPAKVGEKLRTQHFDTGTIVINGNSVEIDADADTPLLWIIRERLKLTGTKFGCGIAQCGACTVHLTCSQVEARSKRSLPFRV